MTQDAWWAQVRAEVDAGMAARLGGAWPARFSDAMRWPVDAGGKRFRPAAVIAAFEAVDGADVALARAGAVAVELVHTYSLVHDDLPAMDDDDERRGRPTCHVVFGDAPAILVGDALLTEAFSALGDAAGAPEARIRMVAALARAAGAFGMVGGQAADIGMEGRVADVAGVERLHRLKTGALIRASAELGGLAGGATDAQLAALRAWGEAVGLAFQLADDLLDADEAADADGPPSFVRLVGLAETAAWADRCAAEAITAAASLPRPERLIDLARLAARRAS
jgi:geranylgeranyl pyrophosphate synthase